MIRPTDQDLLEGIAASLEQTVLPDLARGTAPRRQLQAAIAILRRIAFALPRQMLSIDADNRDMAEVLTRIAEASPRTSDQVSAALGCLPDEPSARNLALQATVSALAEQADDDAQSLLTDLYRRMTDRQLALIAPAVSREKPGVPL